MRPLFGQNEYLFEQGLLICLLKSVCGVVSTLGGAQGAPLGMWIFQFRIDKAGLKTNPVPLGEIITQPLKKRKRIKTAKKKMDR